MSKYESPVQTDLLGTFGKVVDDAPQLENRGAIVRVRAAFISPSGRLFLVGQVVEANPDKVPGRIQVGDPYIQIPADQLRPMPEGYKPPEPPKQEAKVQEGNA